MNETVRSYQPGDRVGGGRYLLKKILGRGGMGMVWLALDEKLNELVALKFISGPLMHDAAGLAMLRREVARAHRLTHPNILRVHDLHEHVGEDPFIAMEYVDGPTLHQLRAERPQNVLPWSELAPLTAQLCAALHYAHGEGVVHRDLKPGNVMLDARGRVRLCDFGIAALFNEQTTRMTGTGGISGTPAYMSPQQMNGDRPTPSDDLYALGAMLYELLTSEPPFAHGNIFYQVQNKEAPTLRQRMTDLNVRNVLPPETETVILACLAKEAAKRPKDTREISRRLGVTEGSAANSAPARSKLPLLVAASVVVLGVVAGILWSRNGDSSPAITSAVPEEAPLAGTANATAANERVIFEDGFDQFDALGRPAQWYPGAIEEARTAGVRFLPEQEGDVRFYRIEHPRHLAPEATLRARIPIQPGGKWIRYTIRLRTRDLALGKPRAAGITASSGLVLTFRTEDDQGIVPYAPILVQTKAADWTILEQRFPIPTNAAAVRLSLGMFNCTGTMDIDYVRVTVTDDVASAVPAEAPLAGTANPASFPPGQWTKVFTKKEDLPANVRTRGVLWRDGWIDGTTAKTASPVLIPATMGHNQGIRLHGKIAPGQADPTASAVRVRRSGLSNGETAAEYKLTLRGMDATPRAGITYYDDAEKTAPDFEFIVPDSPPKPGDEFDLELIAIGDKLYGKFNGKPLPVVTDPRLTEGELGFQTRHLARDIEVINLDGLSEAEARKAAGISTSPASDLPQPKAWVDDTVRFQQDGVNRKLLTTDGEWLAAPQGIHRFALADGREFADVAVRVSFRNSVSVKLRQSEERPHFPGYIGEVALGSASISFSDPAAGKGPLCPAFQLGPDYQPDTPHEMVFAAHGGKVSLWLDGKLLGTAIDTRSTHGRLELTLFGPKARVRKVEYLPLDGLSEAEALQAAGLSTSPSPPSSPAPAWQRAVFPTQVATDEIKSKGGIGMDGALLGVWKDAIFVANPTQPQRDAAVRITAPTTQAWWPIKIFSRMPPGRYVQYSMHIWPRMVEVTRYDRGDQKLKTFPLTQPLTEGGEFTAQFASIGSEHYVWLNGQLLGSVTDDALGQPGKLGIQANDGRFKSVETLLLDGLSEAEARKAAGIWE